MLNDRLIVPSQCFRNKLVFLSLWIRVLLFPLHFVLMRAAIWFHCSLKHSESNFLFKTYTRKPDFPLSNCWKSLVPDVLHLAISSSVKRTLTEARAAVNISVPFATITVTLGSLLIRWTLAAWYYWGDVLIKRLQRWSWWNHWGRKHERQVFFVALTECAQNGTLRFSGLFTGCGCFLISLSMGAAIETHQRCDCFGIQCWEVRIIIK